MSENKIFRQKMRDARRRRTRIRVKRTQTRPRLAVFRTAKHMYAQVIDDKNGSTLVSSSTLIKEFTSLDPKLSGVEAAKWVGKDIAEKAKAKGVTRVVFDRGSFLYHGRVKALAEAAREQGLDF